MFSFVKFFNLLQGLVGFGYLRLRRSKVVPQLSKLLSSASGVRVPDLERQATLFPEKSNSYGDHFQWTTPPQK